VAGFFKSGMDRQREAFVGVWKENSSINAVIFCGSVLECMWCFFVSVFARVIFKLID
jgi:hypothetical protein